MKVLVTGGSGFLGRHIIWALLERRDIDKIRVLDRVPLDQKFITENNLNNDNFEMMVGDIRDKKCVDEATKDMKVVIHAASIVITNSAKGPDESHVKEVNIRGTINLIKASIENGVDIFIYTGSAEMGRSWNEVIDANEDEIDRRVLNAEGSILSIYSSTKWSAERYVLQSNGSPLSSDSDEERRCLRTVSIRPPGIYGEYDFRFIPQIITQAKTFCGLLPVLGSRTGKMAKVYAGNVAWAHMCALDKLCDPTTAAEVGGKAFIVGDDSSPENPILYFQSSLKANKITILPFCISLYVLVFFYILMKIVVLILQPIIHISLPMCTDELVMFCVSTGYDSSKIRQELDYEPKYSAEEALRRSNEYYSRLKDA